MVTIFAFNAGKVIMENATVKETMDHPSDTTDIHQTIHITKKLTYALHIQGYGQIHKVKSENLTTTIYSGRSVFRLFKIPGAYRILDIFRGGLDQVERVMPMV